MPLRCASESFWISSVVVYTVSLYVRSKVPKACFKIVQFFKLHTALGEKRLSLIEFSSNTSKSKELGLDATFEIQK